MDADTGSKLNWLPLKYQVGRGPHTKVFALEITPCIAAKDEYGQVATASGRVSDDPYGRHADP